MAVNNQQNQVPTSLVPIGSFGAGKVPVTVDQAWYLFFQALSGLVADIVGGVLGFTLEERATATGNSQATALAMATEWIEVTTTPPNSGVMLHNYGPGVPSSVFNSGANTLRVYPPVGCQIDGLGTNGPYLLAPSKMQVFSQTRTSQFLSMQLG